MGIFRTPDCCSILSGGGKLKTAQICSHHGDTSAEIIARGLCAEPNSSSAKTVPEPRTLWKILLMGKRKVYKRRKSACRLIFWRSGRDSNPRGIAPKLISSQPRYDHFDTAAYIFRNTSPQNVSQKKERTDGENYKNFSP